MSIIKINTIEDRSSGLQKKIISKNKTKEYVDEDFLPSFIMKFCVIFLYLLSTHFFILVIVPFNNRVNLFF
jgi:hypothetical protein